MASDSKRMKLALRVFCWILLVFGVLYLGIGLYGLSSRNSVPDLETPIEFSLAPLVFGLLTVSLGLSGLIKTPWAKIALLSVFAFYVGNAVLGLITWKKAWSDLLSEDMISAEVRMLPFRNSAQEKGARTDWVYMGDGHGYSVEREFPVSKEKPVRIVFSFVQSLNLAVLMKEGPAWSPTEFVFFRSTAVEEPKEVRIWNCTWTYGLLVFRVSRTELLEILGIFDEGEIDQRATSEGSSSTTDQMTLP